MRIRKPTVLHTLALFLSALLIGVTSLTLTGTPYARSSPAAVLPYTTVSDSDSVASAAALAADSSTADSATASADSTIGDSTGIPLDSARAGKYLSRRSRLDPPVAQLRLDPSRSRLRNPFDSYYRQAIEMDSTGRHYVVREFVGEQEVRQPLTIDRSTYRQHRLQTDLAANWQELIEQRDRQNNNQSGFGVNVVIPGAQESAFTTIFGKPEVDLRVNGQANINLGFNYQKSDQQVSITGDQGRLDPDFGQEINLGITGTIGDKLQVDVNWDTESTFDYENQLKLEYTGYDDDIVQRVVAGNVFLDTPSQLIQGGQSLFGIRSDFQIGGLNLTTVMSQQEGQSNELNIEGGSQTSEYALRTTEYENNTHFFLGYYFRNSWEPAFSDPNQIVLGPNFQQITDIEVWKLKQTTVEGDNERQVVAMVDLGEPSETREGGSQYLARNLPSPSIDAYTETDLNNLRDGSQDAETYLSNTLGLSPQMYQKGKFRKLEQGNDFDFDQALGYLTLNSSLSNNEALAIAFRYQRRDGSVVEVGDFASGGSTRQVNDDRLVLKLIRASNPQPDEATWDLTLRNIYKIQSRGISREGFNLDLEYDKPGSPAQGYLPDISLPNQQTLLQALGLDRLNQNGSPSPDNSFDFMPGITIDPGTGRVIFPYLEPFGQRMVELITNDNTQFSGTSQQEALDLYAFPALYNEKQRDAQRDSQHDIYSINGSVTGSVQEQYNLGFGIVEGSVEVTSGGARLTPGQDYQVNSATGTVTITNPTFLTPGRDVNISYERKNMMQIQKKTLLGMRASYSFNEDLSLGATAMRLSEKPLTDKFRVGEEPLSNTIWGMDGSLELEPRWLTQAVDALPFIQTKAPSAISVQGEFAQLRPGHAQTTAIDRTQERLQSEGLRMNPDERGGVSFVDDFEGVENTYSMGQPGGWRLSAPPAEIDVPGATTDSLGTNYRASFSWYKIPRNVYEHIEMEPDNTAAVRPIHIKEVYPERDTRGETITDLQTFDIYFDPTRRGPYNYTRDLRGFKNNPQNNWGGMTQRIPESYTDFNLQNVEFVEFVFSPHSRDAGGTAADQAKLMVNLGTISEDIVPNGELNTEDGLAIQDVTNGVRDEWGRFSSGIQDGVINVDQESGKTEDRGLDGLPSSTRYADYQETEQQFFSSFLESVRQQYGENSVEYQRALADPSADDYHYWRDSEYFNSSPHYPDGALLQERFSRFFTGLEMNSFEAQNVAGSGVAHVGNARTPDSEDANLNANLDVENSYYEYELPLDKEKLDELAAPSATDDYVVSKIKNRGIQPNSEWYLVRIPVRDFTEKVGNIQDFSFIESMRMWTTGHRAPITMRFASVELVGSRWEKARQIGNQQNDELANTRLSISTINNEENPQYEIPFGTIRSQQRLSTGQTQESREQSMVLRIENLEAGDERAVTKTYNDGLDLLKYSNLRMFLHGHGEEGGGYEDREDLKVFVRLALNNTNDYYEYETPLTPSDPLSTNPDEVWQTNQNVEGYDQPIDLNSVNIELSALNRLKAERDNENAPTDSLFVPDRDYEFAPPGTRLGIKGNPTLSGVKTIMIGVRNPADSLTGKTIQEATVWTNELRVSGYDDEPGWASIASARVKLADLATIDANMRTKSDRFGELSSGLANRQQTNNRNWAVNSTLNLHKFLPERYGWNIPLSYSVRSNQSTPRYSPNRGDIRLEELTTQVEENQDLNPSEKARRKQQLISQAQTENITNSMSIRTGKQNSQSPILRHTVDNISVSYNRSETAGHNPSTQVNDSWQWSSTVNYRLNLRQPHTFGPLGFLEGVWGLGWLSGLQMGYLPSTLNMSASASRNFNVSRDRPQFNIFRPDVDSLRLDGYNRFPYRENHEFRHRRSFGIQYSPFGFLGLGYDANTDQSFNEAGADTTYNVATIDTVFQNIRREEAINSGIADSSAVEMERLEVSPFHRVLQDVIQGGRGVRTETFDQTFQGNLRPNIGAVGPLDWITVQPISYETQFGWQNGPTGEDSTGASVSNTINLQGNVRMNFKGFWRKFDFYRSLEQQSSSNNRSGGSQSAASDTTESSFWTAFVPDFGGIARRAFLTLTSMEDLQLSYRSNWNSRSSNVKGGYSLLDAFDGQAPSLGYRLGLDRGLSPEQRWIGNRRLQVNDNLTANYTLGAQTSLAPSNQLDISLNSDVSWSDNENISYRQTLQNRVDQTTSTSGNNQASVWGLSGSYREFFERQLATYRADLAASGGENMIRDANRDGQVVLTNKSLISDFRNTFLFAPSTLDDRGYLPIPLPNWNITYSGLGNWPLIRSLMQSATIRHNYSSSYTTNFKSNLAAGFDDAGNPLTKTFSLGPKTVQYEIPNVEAGSIRMNEQFNPLIGVNLSWQGGFQTNVTWSKSNSTALSPTNADIRTSKSNNLSLSANYSKRGMRLPIPLPFVESQTLNNTIRFSLSVSRSKERSRRYLLASDLEKVIRGQTDDENFLNPPVQSTERISMEPRLTYQFSNRVSADFFVRYQRVETEGSRVPATTNMNGGFNIRVSISNSSSRYGGGGTQRFNQQNQMNRRSPTSPGMGNNPNRPGNQ